jgi:putative FmdB family regulatory protein
MPIYDYECMKCQKVFEVILKIGEGVDGLICPECGTKKLRQRITPFYTHGWSKFLDKMEQKLGSS